MLGAVIGNNVTITFLDSGRKNYFRKSSQLDEIPETTHSDARMTIDERIRKRIEEKKESPLGFNLFKFADSTGVSYHKLWNFLKRGGSLTSLEGEKIENALNELR